MVLWIRILHPSYLNSWPSRIITTYHCSAYNLRSLFRYFLVINGVYAFKRDCVGLSYPQFINLFRQVKSTFNFKKKRMRWRKCRRKTLNERQGYLQCVLLLSSQPWRFCIWSVLWFHRAMACRKWTPSPARGWKPARIPLCLSSSF